MSDTGIELMIEKLTSSGQEELDNVIFAEFKKYCKMNRDNNEMFNYLGRLIFHQLQQKHAQIRFNAFLLIEYLFKRSHQFRLYTCQHLDKFFKFCFQLQSCELKDGSLINISSRNKKEILQPAQWANKLKNRALECFKSWFHEFRNGYYILNDGFDILVKQRLLQQVSTLPTQPIVQTEGLTRLNQNQNAVLVKQLEELENEINLLIIQIDTCFELLIPKFKISEDNFSKNNLTFRPMQGLSFNIILNSKVEITYDDSNCDLINNLHELCQELAKYEKRLNNMKNSNSLLHDKKINEDFDATIQNLKLKITSILWKEKEIKIINFPKETEEIKTISNSECNSSDNEDDFEDVVETEDHLLISKIEGFKAIVPQSAKPNSGEASSVVEGQCNAPLPSGRLCPRRDRVKCPFHGKIIPRDSQGLPLDPVQREKELKIKFEKEANQWKDPKYLKALSEQTGKDLQLCTRRKRNKHTALVDLKELNDTPRQRLKKKLRKELSQYQARGIHVDEFTNKSNNNN